MSKTEQLLFYYLFDACGAQGRSDGESELPRGAIGHHGKLVLPWENER
jgi:hypothetical protein